METLCTKLNDVRLVRLDRYEDTRGFFMERYQTNRYTSQGIDDSFCQINHSYSKKGVLRGMHFQTTPGQAKLVSVLCGKIYDVVVDMRPDSSTFKQWEGFELDEKTQLYVPAHFAHGFLVLSEEAHVLYQVSSVYNPSTEKGFVYNDSEVNIQWPLQPVCLSKKDQDAPSFREALCLCG